MPLPPPVDGTIQNNQIWYTSVGDVVVTPVILENLGFNIVSNVYSDGKGVITLEDDLVDIGDGGFLGKSDLGNEELFKTITLPNSVERIGDYAFVGCANLTSVNFGTGLTELGVRCFEGCPHLSSFSGGCVAKDGRCVIVNNRLVAFAPGSLTEYTFDGISTIEQWAVAASGLKRVTISDDVERICECAFHSSSALEQVTIPPTIREVGQYAFYNCNKLNRVDITDLASWVAIAFEDTSANPLMSAKNLYLNDALVENLVIPEGVTGISPFTFFQATCLKSLTIPQSVTSIGDGAFALCNNLNEVRCKSIVPPILGSENFTANLDKLQIYVPTVALDAYKSADVWREYADKIVADTSVPIATDWSIVGTHNSWETTTGIEMTNIGDFAVAENVTFESTTEFKFVANKSWDISYGYDGAIEFGKSCQAVLGGSNIVLDAGTYNLKLNIFDATFSIEMLGTGEYNIGDVVTIGGVQGVVFQVTPSVKILSVVESTEVWSKQRNSTNATNMDDGSKNMSVIKSYSGWESQYPAFKWCADLGSGWYMPANDELKAIFNHRTTINTRLSANGFTTLGAGWYWSSTESSINGAHTVDLSTGSVAGEYKDSMQRVRAVLNVDKYNEEPPIGGGDDQNIPNNQIWYTSVGDNVISVGNSGAFGSAITSHKFENGKGVITCAGDITLIGNEAFLSCDKLLTITIPQSVKSIEERAFWGCSSLESITLPDAVTTIRERAFEDCKALKSVVLPQSLESIGICAFSDTALENVQLPSQLKTIGASAFLDCTSLSSVSMQEGIETIEVGAFRRCTALTSVTIPQSVTTLEDSVFAECTALKTFYGKFATADNLALVANGTLAAFAYNNNVTSYTVPEGVTKIGENLFYNYQPLQYISMPESVTQIGDYAFYCCVSLKDVVIPNGVSVIGGAAFFGCSSLTEIAVADASAMIHPQAFCGCTNLETVSMGTTSASTLSTYSLDGGAKPFMTIAPIVLCQIGEEAFSGCTKLHTLNLGMGVSAIDDRAFSSCTNITTVNYHSLGSWCGMYFGNREANPLYVSDATLYVEGNAITGDILIPTPVDAIADYAFAGYKGITSVTMTSDVSSIGISAFNGCSNLLSVYCKSDTPPTLRSVDTFEGNAAERKIYVPVQSVESYKKAENWSAYADVIEVDQSLEQQNNQIFYTSSNGATVTPHSNNVFGANIVSNVYENGQGVITFDGDVTQIGKSAFYGTLLKSIVLPKSVTAIESESFGNCEHLTHITIPEGVVTIGWSAFINCTSLQSIVIPQSVAEIGLAPFINCSKLAMFEGKFATEDGRCLVVNNVLNSFAPANLTDYHNIPSDVITIGCGAFSGCSNLTNVTIPSSVVTVEANAFTSCTALTTITIPDSVTTIGDMAFMSCKAVNTVTIGRSVTSIGVQGFFDCNALLNLYCKPATPPTIGSSCFGWHDDNRLIYVPTASEAAYKSAWSEYADAIVADGSEVVVAGTIMTTADFVAFAAAVNAGDYSAWKGSDGQTKLGADIDMTGVEWTPITSFDGVFNGQGHTISKWSTTKALFEQNRGTIKELVIDASCTLTVEPSGDEDQNFAFIVGRNESSGVVEGCVNNGDISASAIASGANRIGGIVGASYGLLRGCTNVGDITINSATTSTKIQNIGGVVGFLNPNADGKEYLGQQLVVNCTNSGNISVLYGGQPGKVCIGGVVGATKATQLSTITATCLGTITGCVNTGELSYSFTTLSAGTYANVGGIIGYSEANIASCDNYGSVAYTLQTTDTTVAATRPALGGIVGSTLYSITNCNNHGAITGKGVWGAGTSGASHAGGSQQPAFGGVAGFAGATEVSTDYAVSYCANYGKVEILDYCKAGGGTYGYIGGVVGGASIPVDNSHNHGELDFKTYISRACMGGVLGYGQSTATNCSNDNNSVNMTILNVTKEGASMMGGVVGRATVVDNCHNLADVSCVVKDGIFGSSSIYTAAVVGYADSEVKNSSHTADYTLTVEKDVQAIVQCAGVVGQVKTAAGVVQTVTNCSTSAGATVILNTANTNTNCLAGVVSCVNNGITSCVNRAAVTLNVTAANTGTSICRVAGVASIQRQNMTECINGGLVTANMANSTCPLYIAGVLATNYDADSTVSSSTNSGNIVVTDYAGSACAYGGVAAYNGEGATVSGDCTTTGTITINGTVMGDNSGSTPGGEIGEDIYGDEL